MVKGYPEPVSLQSQIQALSSRIASLESLVSKLSKK
jgi:hypothetical protein